VTSTFTMGSLSRVSRSIAYAPFAEVRRIVGGRLLRVEIDAELHVSEWARLGDHGGVDAEHRVAAHRAGSEAGSEDAHGPVDHPFPHRVVQRDGNARRRRVP